MMKPSRKVIQDVILKDLKTSNYHKGEGALCTDAKKHFVGENEPENELVTESLWVLVSRGLLFPSFGGNIPIEMALTSEGLAVAKEEDYNPDYPERYLERMREDVHNMDVTVQKYIEEALITFNNRCYLATAVMLGVASEAAFLDMANSFADWIKGNPQSEKLFEKLIKTLEKDNYSTKYNTFRKKLEEIKRELPKELKDNLDGILCVGNVLREYRNDAGHPTGKKPEREDCLLLFGIFPGYIERLYGLRSYFQN